MPSTKRSTTTRREKKKEERKKRRELSGLDALDGFDPDEVYDLPSECEDASGNFDDFCGMLHGEKKIGKTSTLLQPDPDRVLVIQCDPAQKSYKRMERVVRNWPVFLGYLKKLEKEFRKKRKYDRVVIDRIDILYGLCYTHVCEEEGFEHPSEESYGAGWSAIRQEFAKAMARFMSLPCGRWFICHSTWKEVETRDGDEITKIVPVLSKQAEDVITGQVDMWFAYTFMGERRVLTVSGDERAGAGHRVDSEDSPHFRTTKGKRVKEIDMGSSPKNGWSNLMAAFNNEQDYRRVSSEVDREEVKRKKRKKDKERERVAK